MILLQAHSLNRTGAFEAETCGLTMAEKDGQIQFTVGPEAPEMETGQWIMDDEEPGAGIVYRIRTIENNYGAETRTVTAEHIIKVLKDTAIFGEVTPEDMGGSETAVSAETAIRYALSRQSDWVMPANGGFGYSVSAGYSFNGDSVYEAIETVCTTLENCWWSYDLTVYPFKIYIQPKETTASCEMRMGRNISTIKRTVDASRMYTRIYPIGKDNLHITGSFLSMNEGTYGTIMKVETDQTQETEADLRLWALGRLRRHCEPSVTVSISGMELSEATGEPLDRLRIGRACRVPLPEYATFILENITRMQWRDKKKEKETVTVTLANTVEDVASIIRQEMASTSATTGKASRSGAKKAEEDHAWFVDTKDKVAMVAEAVGGQDENGNTNWSRVSTLCVDGNGIESRVTKTEGDVVTSQSRITQTEDSISLALYTAKKNFRLVTRAKFNDFPPISEADENTIYLDNSTGTYYGLYNGEYTRASITKDENDNIISAHFIKAAEIAMSINESGESEAKIDAHHVYIGTGNTKEILAVATDRYAQVVGSFVWENETDENGQVVLDEQGNPKKKLKGLDGSGQVFNSDGSGGWGIWNKGELSAGIFVELGEGETTYTHVKGDTIVLGSSGLTADDLETWAKNPTNNGGVFAKYFYAKTITADNVSARDSLDVDGNAVVDKVLVVGDVVGQQVIAHNGKVSAKDVDIKSTGRLEIIGTENGEHYDLNYLALRGMIKSVSVDNNTLTLTPFSGSAINFSKATSLSGDWSSGSYVVTAKQTNYSTVKEKTEETVVNTHTYTPLLQLNGSGNAADFTAEIYTETTSSGTPVKTAQVTVPGYLNLAGATTSSYVGVYTDRTVDGNNTTYSGLIAMVRVGSLYSDGRNVVKINKGTWSGGLIRFNKSVGTDDPKEVRLSNKVTWGDGDNANKATVEIWDGMTADAQQGGVDTGYKITVNAYDRYKAGFDAVGAPTVSLTGISANQASNVSGSASIANKFGDNTPRSTSISLSVEGGDGSKTFSNANSDWTHYCVEVKNGSTVVGRADCNGIYGLGVAAGNIEGQNSVKVIYNDSYTPSGASTPIKAVVPSTANNAVAYVPITLETGSLDTSTGRRTFAAKAGSATVDSVIIADYRAGYYKAVEDVYTDNEVVAIGSTVESNVTINTYIGVEGLGIIRLGGSNSLTLSKSTFTDGSGATKDCVIVEDRNVTVGRISCEDIYNAGYRDGSSVTLNLTTITVTTNGTYKASNYNANGFSQVTVNVPTTASLTTLQTTGNGTFKASDYGVDGFSQVKVEVPSGNYDSGYASGYAAGYSAGLAAGSVEEHPYSCVLERMGGNTVTFADGTTSYYYFYGTTRKLAENGYKRTVWYK